MVCRSKRQERARQLTALLATFLEGSSEDLEDDEAATDLEEDSFTLDLGVPKANKPLV